jgi:mono/diheme cytochrome c family protein
MKPIIPITAAITVAAVAAAGIWLSRADATPNAPAAKKAEKASPAERIARGKYIVSTAGCHDCHTPWKPTATGAEPDMTLALSGHPEGIKVPAPPAPAGIWTNASIATNTAHSGPWGVSFTANLTPDPETGTGKWTKENFIQTIRTGRHLGRGRPILPPMPIPVYNNFSDKELGAIFAYLQTLPPIKNRVPDPLPPPAKPKKT